MAQFCCVERSMILTRDVRTSILLHMMKFDKVFKHCVKSMFSACFILMLFVIHRGIVDTLIEITNF